MRTLRHPPRLPRRQPPRCRTTRCDATAPPPALPPYPGDAAPPAALTAWRAAADRVVTRFMLPTAAIPLCDPLQTLVDVTVVGRCASTAALAALGPNSQIFTFIGYALTGLNAAVVAEVATCLQSGDVKTAGELTSAALAVATAVGCAATVALLTFGPALIALTGAPAAVRGPALTYLRIRAWACPLTLVTAVAQAALLAARAPAAPLAAVALQVAANVVLDVWLVAGLGWGLAGAAAATVAAQAAGTTALLVALVRSGPAAPSITRLRAALSRGGSAASLRATGGTVTLVYFAKVAAYWLIQGGANALPSTAAVAAHQPVWQAWTLTSFAHTPLDAAALAFVPAARSRAERAALLRVVLRLAARVGVVTAAIAAGAAALPSLFTHDAALHPAMRALAPQAALATLACAADVAASGALVALRRPRALVRSMAVAAAAVAAARGVARAAGRDSLAAVWWALVVFFVARALGSVGALWAGGEARRQANVV